MTAPDLQAWVGRTRQVVERLHPFPAQAFAALLDRDPATTSTGGLLPPGWHWLYFHSPTRTSELGADGHERRGAFLPPVPLPRRMWAGGRLEFLHPLPVGVDAERHSTITAIEEKDGRSGPLVFVTVTHEVRVDGTVAVREEQDLVYRQPPPPVPAAPGTPYADLSSLRVLQRFPTDPVTLFRFSALTYNGHRIHYDHPYATSVEGYPDLVVHGPLLALLLLDAADREARPRGLARFAYRGLAPIFCGEEVVIGAEPSTQHERTLVAATARGPAMRAQAIVTSDTRDEQPS